MSLGYDAQEISNAWQGPRAAREGYRVPDEGDPFPTFTRQFSLHVYPDSFQPVVYFKYDGKTPPQQWLRTYSKAIEIASGKDITKVIYFPKALESPQLTWLESLMLNSSNSWGALR